jgi:hypothetical protein
LEPIARHSPNPALKLNAQSQLDVLQRIEINLAKYKAEQEAYEKQRQARAQESAAAPGEATAPPLPPMRPLLRRRQQGAEVSGLLTKMDCSEKGTTLYMTVGNEKLVFHTTQPAQVEFVTFTQTVGDAIECGEFKPAKPVRVIYRSPTDPQSKYRGEPIVVEFVKPEN